VWPAVAINELVSGAFGLVAAETTIEFHHGSPLVEFLTRSGRISQ
jgi:hypothetical protein